MKDIRFVLAIAQNDPENFDDADEQVTWWVPESQPVYLHRLRQTRHALPLLFYQNQRHRKPPDPSVVPSAYLLRLLLLHAPDPVSLQTQKFLRRHCSCWSPPCRRNLVSLHDERESPVVPLQHHVLFVQRVFLPFAIALRRGGALVQTLLMLLCSD